MTAIVQGALASGCALAAFGAIGAARAQDGAARRALDLYQARSIDREHRFAAPAFVSRAVEEAAVPLSADRAWALWAFGCVAIAIAGATLGGLPLSVIGVVSWAGSSIVAWRLLRHRRDAARDTAVPHLLDAIARGLRSGASLQQSLAESVASGGVLGVELETVAAEADRGSGVVVALESWAARAGLQSIRLAVSALCLGVEAGGAQAQAVDAVATTCRQRLAVTGEARALASQARLSAVVIAFAPLVFCALASVADPRVAAFLTGSPLGWVLLVAGLSLDAVGALWMGRLTHL